MLSAVLYGRNDSHGYNLHKRAAISLNCIAAVLQAPGDEIIFVDYNTPDDLPTFPEAIADTLTDDCKRRLRILRLRPAVHQAYRNHTHLVALESLSRNVAIRRSNPENRWILSTNTDMVFALKSPWPSLSQAVADLADGYYALPRFDMPQALWESVNRLDPQSVIDDFTDWGQRFHINEVVYGNPSILFDAPGDFQLMPRADIHAIHGFHEGMLRGWHVDSNLCRRMELHFGPPRSLEDRVIGFHCDHSRQATLASKSDKVENDPLVFFDLVDTPGIPEQADSWGLPDQHIEEIRLSPAQVRRCAGALTRLLPPNEGPVYQAGYGPDRYNDLSYPLHHAFPYLVDQLVTLPKGAKVAYFGGRDDAFALLQQALTVLELHEAPLLSRKVARYLQAETLGRPVIVTDIEEIMETADAFVFEFGTLPLDESVLAPWHEAIARAETPDQRRLAHDALSRQRIMALSPAWQTRVGILHAEFLTVVAYERRRVVQEQQLPRKFLTVNAIHNLFERIVNQHVGITWSPFTLRLRHGYVKPAPSDGEAFTPCPALQRDMTAALGRARRVEPLEITMAEADLRHILAAENLNTVAPWRFSAPLLALLASPATPQRLALTAAALEPVAAAAAVRRLAVQLRRRLALPPELETDRTAPSFAPALSKLCAAEDWDSPPWWRFADEFVRDSILTVKVGADSYFKRSRGVWERAQFLYAASALGKLRSDARALVVTRHVDGLYMHLSNRLAQTCAVLLDGDASQADWLAKSRLYDPDALTIHQSSLRDGGPAFAQPFDLILLTQNALLAVPADRLAVLLAWLDRQAGVGSVIAFAMEIGLSGCRRTDTVLPVQVDALAQALNTLTGWCVPQPFDWTVSDLTLDRAARNGSDETQRPHLVRLDGEAIYTMGVMTCLKTGETGDAVWDDVAKVFEK